MPNPATQHIVCGTSDDGRVAYWTAAMGSVYPKFLRDRARAYPLSLEAARDIATRLNVSNGLAGFRFDTEPYLT